MRLSTGTYRADNGNSPSKHMAIGREDDDRTFGALTLLLATRAAKPGQKPSLRARMRADMEQKAGKAKRLTSQEPEQGFGGGDKDGRDPFPDGNSVGNM